ncbi:transient receptor potential cation channel subfamily V member 3-like [Discoglossus pictus]
MDHNTMAKDDPVCNVTLQTVSVFTNQMDSQNAREYVEPELDVSLLIENVSVFPMDSQYGRTDGGFLLSDLYPKREVNTDQDSPTNMIDGDLMLNRKVYTEQMDSPTYRTENNPVLCVPCEDTCEYETQTDSIPLRPDPSPEDEECELLNMTEETNWISHFLHYIPELTQNDIARCLDCFRKKGIKLSSLQDKETGKTCLMKVLLQPKDHTFETVKKLLAFAQQQGDMKQLLNAEYTSKVYLGQTALHIAIERRQEEIVKYLVQMGADLNIEARGQFFQMQKDRKDWFYFGGFPLSLAACTKQYKIVKFLIDNSFMNCANIDAQDNFGNTVLHALVLSSGGSKKHYKSIARLYDMILIESEKQRQEKKITKPLENFTNNKMLTPLQLAAKKGKVQILKHILQRNFDQKHRNGVNMNNLSRKFLEWEYGPVSCSLYDLSQVDTMEDNSVLHIAVYNKEHHKSDEVLSMEPLQELLEIKWNKFACFMFYLSTILYLCYMTVFTVISRNKHQATETSKNVPAYIWYLAGQIYTFISALLLIITVIREFFYAGYFKFPSHIANSYFYILFLIQGVLVMFVNMWNWIRGDFQDSILALALILGWYNLLYFSRGIKITGVYSIMIQKMIIRDVSSFIFVYVVFLLGFGTALSALAGDCSQDGDCSPYSNILSATLELFKLTLGLGDLAVHEQSNHPTLFLIILILYVIFTFVLLLNMLIALMGETVGLVSQETERIWKIQRAMAILDLEKILPRTLRKRFHQGKIFTGKEARIPYGEEKMFLRVNEVFSEYQSNKRCRINEDPGMNKKASEAGASGKPSLIELSLIGRKQVSGNNTDKKNKGEDIIILKKI